MNNSKFKRELREKKNLLQIGDVILVLVVVIKPWRWFRPAESSHSSDSRRYWSRKKKLVHLMPKKLVRSKYRYFCWNDLAFNNEAPIIILQLIHHLPFIKPSPCRRLRSPIAVVLSTKIIVVSIIIVVEIENARKSIKSNRLVMYSTKYKLFTVHCQYLFSRCNKTDKINAASNFEYSTHYTLPEAEPS